MTPPIGLELITEYLTPEEEVEVMKGIPQKRKRKKHPRDKVVKRNSVHTYWNEEPATPPVLAQLRDRMVADELLPSPVTRITVNEYYPEDALGAHIDTPEQGIVIGVLSLLSSATMVFAREGYPDYVVELPPRSVVFLRGESRYLWSHAVLPLAALRYSVAFHGTPMQIDP
jgi:alkylated DNA repair dioxygenase AlkB